jgi:hypothetical protein
MLLSATVTGSLRPTCKTCGAQSTRAADGHNSRIISSDLSEQELEIIFKGKESVDIAGPFS